MFLCLKGRLLKAWGSRTTHFALSSQLQDVSESEKNRVSEARFDVVDSFGHTTLVNNEIGRTTHIFPTGEATRTFKNLLHWLESSDRDTAFWWRTTGPFLGLLLSEATYDPHSQYQALIFYHRFIAPSLGPQPAGRSMHAPWKSYMTDDYSPIEFSWNWNNSTKPPKIRCTMEAIPVDVGAIDTFNQNEVHKLVRGLRVTLPYVNWELFDYFTSAFRPPAGEVVSQLGNGGSRSSIFLGFEFEGDKVTAKAYFAPVVVTGETQWEAIFRSIRALDNGRNTFPALVELNNFFSFSPEGTQLKVEGLAIDCVPAMESRLKIYARSPLTSFDSVRAYMTLGGKLSYSDTVWKQLRTLFFLILGLDEAFPLTEDLPFTEHVTGGMMYNYDIKANNAMPEPKLYINTRHYGRNDLEIVQGLAKFMKIHDRAEFVSNYRRAIEGFCTYRALEQECGLQTYVSCALQNDSVFLTSYLSPQVYHRLGFQS